MNLKKHVQDNLSIFEDQKMSDDDLIFKEKLLASNKHLKRGQVFTLKRFTVAASILLMVSLGYFSYIKYEKSVYKKQLIVHLTDDSAGIRLEGIYNLNEEFDKEDNQIIHSLLKVLHEDNNANVKIASIDALLKYANNEDVRKNLIQALENENQAIVQIKLIKTMSHLKEIRAQKSLEQLIEDQNVSPVVKNNALLAMTNLK